jgi:hypothetical protein
MFHSRARLSESRRVVRHYKKKICCKEHGLGFKNSLLYICTGIDFSDRLRIPKALPQKGQPLLLHFDDSITGQAGTRIQLHPNSGEKKPSLGNNYNIEYRNIEMSAPQRRQVRAGYLGSGGGIIGVSVMGQQLSRASST